MATEQEQSEPASAAVPNNAKDPHQVTESTGDPPADAEESSGCNHCTFAVTGATPSFQPIFVCHECFNQNESGAVPLCICQACADLCHDSNDHDVEYIGMGPCYCDCDHIGNCSIYQDSVLAAEKLGAVPTVRAESPSVETPSTAEEEVPAPFVHGDYEVPFLLDTSDVLVQHAQELIRHTKETHWIDQALSSGEMCTLERLAWGVYQHHINRYGSLFANSGTGGGAEWWVQVKDAKSTSREGAIDLHYDKDEVLAESFGIGSFPTLSTVTYLTPTSSAAPTIILDHTYTQGEDHMIDTVLASRPRLGKHLVFDGTLLHGAPSHKDLRPATNGASTPDNGDQNPESSDAIRVTFLVNVWRDRKPAKIQPLDAGIRDKLVQLEGPTVEEPLIMTGKEIPKVDLEKVEDLPEECQHRIELPFVTKGITWDDDLADSGERKDDEEEGDGGLVVTCFPPVPTDDTVLMKLGHGLEAYLDYAEKETEEGEKAGEHESGYV